MLKRECGRGSLFVNLIFAIAVGGAVGVFCGLLVGWILGLVVRWAAPRLAESPVLVLVPVGLALVLALGMIVSVFTDLSRMLGLAREDLERGDVQILHVKPTAVVEQDVDNDEGPILYFDIGDGKILFLWGPWLIDDETYGLSGEEFPEDLDVAEHVNGLPDPHGFPSSEFRITRAPRSGTVFGIEVLGAYLPPARTIGRKEIRITLLSPSAILEGSLDDLPVAMSAHHEQA